MFEFKGKEAAIYDRSVYRVREDILVNTENDDGDDAEEEGMNVIEIANSWTVGVTAPAFKTVASPSSAGVEPLFPRSTW